MKARRGADKREVGAGAPAVAAYIRVSSPSQDYAYQRLAIEAAARGRGEAVGRWYADVASGKSMERPELRRLRADLARGGISRLWVWRLDRLSRSGIADTLNCVNEIRSAGVTLASVADGFALEGSAGDLVLAVLAWAAQHEREKIRENQEAARARLALLGRGWGRPSHSAETIAQVERLLEAGNTPGEIARGLQISKTSIGRIARSKTRGI
jgi:DNA invertase Pin-like site-specific DNA recombinase